MAITICILGNIGAGKSLIASMLKEKLNGFALLTMDDYRRKYNLYTSIQGENVAFDMFIRDVIALEYAIIEASGASKNFSKIEAAISRKGGKIFKVYLHAPKKVLIERVANREAAGYKRPPFPYNMTIDKSMEFIAKAWGSLSADVRIDTSKLPPTAILNYILSYDPVKEALKYNEIAKAKNAWFYEKASEWSKPTREHSEGTLLIEVAIRLLRNGQNGGDAFSIMLCKKDGSLGQYNNVVRYSKKGHYDSETKTAMYGFANDENVGIFKNDWRDLFLWSLDEKRVIRVVTSRLMFLNGKRIWH